MIRDLLIQMGLTQEQADEVYGVHEEILNTTLQDYVSREELETAIGDNVELKNQLETAIANNEADKKDASIHLALAKVGAKNPKAVKALLNLEAVSVDGENLIGFADQIEKLKKSDAYLFEIVPHLSGREPHTGSDGYIPSDEPKDNPFKKEYWNITKQAEIFAKDPEMARKLANVAGVKVSWLGLGN